MSKSLSIYQNKIEKKIAAIFWSQLYFIFLVAAAVVVSRCDATLGRYYYREGYTSHQISQSVSWNVLYDTPHRPFALLPKESSGIHFHFLKKKNWLFIADSSVSFRLFFPRWTISYWPSVTTLRRRRRIYSSSNVPISKWAESAGVPTVNDQTWRSCMAVTPCIFPSFSLISSKSIPLGVPARK